VGTCLARVYDSATTTFAKTSCYITVAIAAPNDIVADVFGTILLTSTRICQVM